MLHLSLFLLVESSFGTRGEQLQIEDARLNIQECFLSLRFGEIYI